MNKSTGARKRRGPYKLKRCSKTQDDDFCSAHFSYQKSTRSSSGELRPPASVSDDDLDLDLGDCYRPQDFIEETLHRPMPCIGDIISGNKLKETGKKPIK